MSILKSDVDGVETETLLFATDKERTDSAHFLKGDPVSFVCTNINSMMGGQAKFWESGRGKDLGLVDTQGRSVPHASMKLKDICNHDDDHLEFQVVSSVINLALGKSLRVAQDKGPFRIKFKNPSEKTGILKNKLAHNTAYMQIDGEYFKVVNADKIEIRLNPSFPRLKVLKYVGGND